MVRGPGFSIDLILYPYLLVCPPFVHEFSISWAVRTAIKPVSFLTPLLPFYRQSRKEMAVPYKWRALLQLLQGRTEQKWKDGKLS